MKRLLVLAVIAPLVVGGVAVATQEEHIKVNICHATSSESHPWEAIQIDDDAYDEHISLHGDFDYDGELKDNGKPTKDGNEWCEDNAPEPPEEEPEEETPVEETPPVEEVPALEAPAVPEQPVVTEGK